MFVDTGCQERSLADFGLPSRQFQRARCFATGTRNAGMKNSIPARECGLRSLAPQCHKHLDVTGLERRADFSKCFDPVADATWASIHAMALTCRVIFVQSPNCHLRPMLDGAGQNRDSPN